MPRLGKSLTDDPRFFQVDLLPAADGLSVGSVNNPWENFYVENLYAGALLPFGDNIDDLGTLTDRYRHLYLGSELYLANGSGGAVAARNQGNTAFISMLWLDTTNDTVLNAATGETVKISVNGIAVETVSSTGVTNTGNLTFSAASAKIIPGATSLLFRNNADSATNLSIADAGLVTVGVGNLTLTAGNLTFGAASAKIIPGATSLLFRNNADNATNLTITDAGALTTRAGITAGGDFAFSATTNIIGTTSVDGADTGRITIFGSGTGSADASRSASLRLTGNENAGAGLAQLVMGGTANFSVIGNNGALSTLTVNGASTGGIAVLGTAGISMGTAGAKLSYTVGGANASSGTAVANGASNVVVNTTSITIKSIVVFSLNTIGGTPGQLPHVNAISAGTSFTFAATAGDTSTYNWAIIETV